MLFGPADLVRMRIWRIPARQYKVHFIPAYLNIELDLLNDVPGRTAMQVRPARCWADTSAIRCSAQRAVRPDKMTVNIACGRLNMPRLHALLQYLQYPCPIVGWMLKLLIQSRVSWVRHMTTS